MFNSLLVVAPHPDDDILGCGGLMHRMRSEGKRVYVAIMCAEDLSRYDEAKEALDGVADDIIVFCFTKFEEAPINRAAGFLESIIEEYKPEAIAIPNMSAHHQDHRKAAEAAIIATRPSGATGRHRPSVVLEYEMAADIWPPRPHADPQLTIELSYEDVLYKHNAMMLHKSQVRPSPSERSSETIAALAQLRGSQAGVKFGEAYVVHRYLI